MSPRPHCHAFTSPRLSGPPVATTGERTTPPAAAAAQQRTVVTAPGETVRPVFCPFLSLVVILVLTAAYALALHADVPRLAALLLIPIVSAAAVFAIGMTRAVRRVRSARAAGWDGGR
ncbi:hypothetical protein [Nocardia wallacei]|uniref:hypothetical protein n=1 Tax=Nocardia wallacei TaxID=480035 RepID=UPI002454B286|nr:hypothetical protein [Nocardia wallacei]